MLASMFNKDLQTQISYLEKTLAKSKNVSEILRRAPKLKLPNWYLGAGTVVQTVWNELHGFPLDYGIDDCDLVYFDTDISAEAQARYIEAGKRLFTDMSIKVDITNEARVHLWYKQEVGIDIAPYTSTEHAINTWPSTASAVGVRYEGEKFIVYAPCGLNDMMGLIIRANKGLITQEVYEKKVKKWSGKWPKLTAVPWDA